MRTLLKGGTVVSARGTRRADVLLENGRVKQVGRLILGKADRVEDVEGCLLFPGFIDAHTHFDLDVKIGGIITKVPQPCGAAGRHHHRH